MLPEVIVVLDHLIEHLEQKLPITYITYQCKRLWHVNYPKETAENKGAQKRLEPLVQCLSVPA